MAAISRAYSRSWFFLRWYRLIYALPVFYFFVDVISRSLQMSGSVLLYWTGILVPFILGIVLDLFLIVAVFRYKDILDVDLSNWALIKTYFWRAFGISVARVFWALVLLSPFCFFVYLVLLAELNGLLIFLFSIGFVGFGIVSFGLKDLGIRILIRRNTGIRESMWQGLKELRTHWGYYLPFIITSMLLTFLPVGSALLLSGTAVVVDRSLTDFLRSVDAVRQSQCAPLLIFNYIITPLNIAATTFIYLDRTTEAAVASPQVEGLEPSASR